MSQLSSFDWFSWFHLTNCMMHGVAAMSDKVLAEPIDHCDERSKSFGRFMSLFDIALAMWGPRILRSAEVKADFALRAGR
jgi:hypothetical protein